MVPLTAPPNALPPFLLFFWRHSLGDVLDDARHHGSDDPHSKLNPEGRALRYKECPGTKARKHNEGSGPLLPSHLKRQTCSE